MTHYLTIKYADCKKEHHLCVKICSLIYWQKYKVKLEHKTFSIEQRIEPIPDEWIIAKIDNEIVGCLGIYKENNIIERFGFKISQLIDFISSHMNYDQKKIKLLEHTKMVVIEKWRHIGINTLITYLALCNTCDFGTCNHFPVVIYHSTFDFYKKIIKNFGIPFRSTKPKHFDRYILANQNYFSKDNIDKLLFIYTLPFIDIPQNNQQQFSFPVNLVITKNKTKLLLPQLFTNLVLQ